MPQVERFPMSIPFGWYGVSYSSELEIGDVRDLHYFGRDLVLFRNEEGEAGLLDAYCPHLGAHLGKGGKVEGDSIRCPFHAWQFRPDGYCSKIPYAKAYRVFNADQIEGLPAEFYILPDPPRDLGTKADPALEAFFAASGAQIDSTKEPRAYYNIKTDRIHMPPIATFHRAAGYYGTLAHELTHWTGATKRLDRLGRFNDRKAYAFEELVAEIGNCMLCAQIGVEPEFDQSAAYVEGWLEAMKEDDRAIFRAASEAQKAVDYIMDRTGHAEQMAAE